MKPFIRIIGAVALTAAACLTARVVSAQEIMAGWAVNSTIGGGGGTPPAPFAATTVANNVTVGPLMKGAGIGAVTTTGVYGGNTWTNVGVPDSEANSIANGLYEIYTVQANPGYTVSFTTNILFFHNSATGPNIGELQYSTDGINYTDIESLPYSPTHVAETTALTNTLAGIAALQNVPSSVTNYFRIVNWGATSTGGTWYINNATPTTMPDLQIIGSVNPVPPAENLATWWVNGITTQAGGVPPAPFANNTAAANVIVTPMTKGAGIGTPTGTANEEYGGNTWTNPGVADSEANSIATSNYVSYAIQAAPGYTISFFTNIFYAHVSATGPSTGELQYSTDGINYTDISPITYPGGGGTSAASALITNNLSAIGTLQNVPSTTTNFFRIVSWGATSTGGTWYIYDSPPANTPVGTNDFAVIGGLTSLNGVIAPTNLVVSPSTLTANAGNTVSFSVNETGGLASNFWYEITSSTTNLIAGATGSTLTLSNVTGANTADYFVVLTNISGAATSSVVSLTVIDPVIQVEPNSSQGLVNGTVQFSVTAAGTSPSYQWYFSDTNGDLLAPAVSLGDASVISGATTSTLTIANLQPADLTNFVVVVTDPYGSVTSSVASLLSGTNSPGMIPSTRGMLALWDFDGPQFTNTAINPNSLNNPAPFIGSGTAFAVGTCFDPGTSPFSGSVDANDVGFDPTYGGYLFTPYGFEQPSPNFSWGTDNYPLNATTGVNKQNGVQFNVSTVGARNITVSYDSRVSATASEYERLQYTTNGTTWIDYPASSTFAGISSTYATYQYSLVGFPGVDNNPNFGVRVVTEFEDTATYGISTVNDWVGTANTYGTAGTVTYDVVAFQGDAITNNNTPPTLSPFVNTNMVDTNTLVLSFSANDLDMPASKLTFSVVSLDTLSAASFTRTVDPTFTVSNPGSTNFLLSISFAGTFIPDPIDAAPILITATDTNGESVTASFLLTVQSINQPPTNSLTLLPATNTLANTALTIPFVVGSARDPYTNLTYVVTSDNNTVIPVGNIVIGGNTNTGNLTLTITPAPNQVGNALIGVTVYDNDPQEPRSTTANISFVTRQNTNVVAVDDFNYDNTGSLDTIATNYWVHLSGIRGQLQVGGGVATVNTSANTENLQAQLTGSPYPTNSGAVLYSSFTVNMSPALLPSVNGSYFTALNDGSGNTADVEDCLVAATNGAAPGFYRLGIANVVGATALNAQMFPQDLTPGQNYVVITSLVLSNGFSTLWVGPTNQSSASVTDTTPPATATNLYSISNFELRESGTTAGSINVGSLAVGLSFNSVFYPAQANPAAFAVTENSTNLLSPVPNDAGWSLNITGVSLDGNETATASGTNISFIPVANFLGTATVGYTIQDNLGNTSTSTITVLVTNLPPLANPDSYNVPENSVNNVLSPLTNDMLETAGGSLSLVPGSLSPTNGTATISGTNVLFTPTTGFTGTATIGYSVTDGIGGTNSSVITVTVGTVAPIPVSAQVSAGNLVLSWNSAEFSLQTATNVAGPYLTIPGATSPYTNLISTNAAGFFRLVH